MSLRATCRGLSHARQALEEAAEVAPEAEVAEAEVAESVAEADGAGHLHESRLCGRRAKVPIPNTWVSHIGRASRTACDVL